MYTTKITSQGTISIPAALRKKYGLKTGETLTIEDNGRLVIYKRPDFATLRQNNQEYIQKKVTSIENGRGFTEHVKEKYGQ